MADVPIDMIDFQDDYPLKVYDRPIAILGGESVNDTLDEFAGRFPQGGSIARRYGWVRGRDGWALQGDANVGWGFIKKAWKATKKVAKKATKPVRRVARTVGKASRKTYKAVVPRKVRRTINRYGRKVGRFAKRAGKTAWKYTKKFGKYALLPVAATFKLLQLAAMALLKKLFGGAMKKLTRRRARYLAYQRRGSTNPNSAETREAARWARKYAKSQGIWGKIMNKVTKKAKTMAKDPRVRAKVAREQKGRRSRVRGYMSGGIVSGAVTASLITASVPIIMYLLKQFLGKAAKQGAPTDPRQASPEQNLMGEIAEGYTRQALQGAAQPGGASFSAEPLMRAVSNYGVQKAQQRYGPLGGAAANYLTQSFRPPATNQPAMTFNYPEPEPPSFDFPAPPNRVAMPGIRPIPQVPPPRGMRYQPYQPGAYRPPYRQPQRQRRLSPFVPF